MRFRERKHALDEARKQLSWQWPRLQIMFILALTGVASFLISWVLLLCGVTQMVVRYPIAIAAGYGVFIALIGIWLWMQRNDVSFDPGLPDINIPIPISGGSAGSGGPSGVFGQGGNFGGGGAGGNLEIPADIANVASNPVTASTSFSGGSPSSSGGTGLDFSLDADDAVWVVLAILALIAGLLAIGYVVYIAPVFFAEVLADSLFAAGLYKSVKGAQGSFWMRTVIWKTIIPAIVVLVFFSLAGYFLQLAVPEASSLGEAIRIIFAS